MGNFSANQKQMVWEKLSKIPNEDPSKFRYDGCGAKLKFDDYDNLNSDFGWNIDHKLPLSKGGNNHPLNLHALHYKNNEKKADNFPDFEGAVQWNSQKGINDKAIITKYCVDADLLQKIGDYTEVENN